MSIVCMIIMLVALAGCQYRQPQAVQTSELQFADSLESESSATASSYHSANASAEAQNARADAQQAAEEPVVLKTDEEIEETKALRDYLTGEWVSSAIEKSFDYNRIFPREGIMQVYAVERFTENMEILPVIYTVPNDQVKMVKVDGKLTRKYCPPDGIPHFTENIQDGKAVYTYNNGKFQRLVMSDTGSILDYMEAEFEKIDENHFVLKIPERDTEITYTRFFLPETV